jgi:imidazolonepropionase-like amidohydrolase
VDVIKIVSADGPETLGKWWTVQTTREEAEACFAEARRLGRQTASHAMGVEGIENVVLSGVDTVEHGWYMDESSCHLMIEHGTTLVGTLSNVVVIDGDPLSDISLVRTGVVRVVQDGRVIRDDLGLMDELRAERRGAAALA